MEGAIIAGFKTVNDDKQGFWLERIFLEKERSSERTMAFDIGRKNIKMKFFFHFQLGI